MTIEKVIRTEEVMEFEIELPYFAKEGNYYYAILNEDKKIRVAVVGDSTWISCNSVGIERDLAKAEPISETEFYQVYLNAIDMIDLKQTA